MTSITRPLSYNAILTLFSRSCIINLPSSTELPIYLHLLESERTIGKKKDRGDGNGWVMTWKKTVDKGHSWDLELEEKQRLQPETDTLGEGGLIPLFSTRRERGYMIMMVMVMMTMTMMMMIERDRGRERERLCVSDTCNCASTYTQHPPGKF